MEEINEDPANRVKAPLVDDPSKSVPGTSHRAVKIDLNPPSRIPPKLKGSKLVFFVDGVCQGTAFEDLLDFVPLRLPAGWIPPPVRSEEKLLEVMENYNDDGTLGYYPLVSVFGGGMATINPGPHFEFPPPTDIETLLENSPRPPTHSQVVLSKNGWRSLNERYDEYYAEQAKLDDQDELQALLALNLQQNRKSIPRISVSTTTAPAPASSRGNGPTAAKRTKLSTNNSFEVEATTTNTTAWTNPSSNPYTSMPFATSIGLSDSPVASSTATHHPAERKTNIVRKNLMSLNTLLAHDDDEDDDHAIASSDRGKAGKDAKKDLLFSQQTKEDLLFS
jgi:hypothetical protein